MIDFLVEAFLSHTTKQKRIASRYRKQLKNWRINVFLAHEDIEGGEEWMKMIIKRIRDCDVFIILLSKPYHRASWTDQEAGIAFAMNKTMIPISLDGTKPYGFMSKYQSLKGSYKPTTKLAYGIFKQILGHKKVKRRVGLKLIDSLRPTKRGLDVRNVAKSLFIYEQLSRRQVRSLLDL